MIQIQIINKCSKTIVLKINEKDVEVKALQNLMVEFEHPRTVYINQNLSLLNKRYRITKYRNINIILSKPSLSTQYFITWQNLVLAVILILFHYRSAPIYYKAFMYFVIGFMSIYKTICNEVLEITYEEIKPKSFT